MRTDTGHCECLTTWTENPDIICVQETKVDEKRFKSDVLAGYEAYFYSCKTNPGYAGT